VYLHHVLFATLDTRVIDCQKMNTNICNILVVKVEFVTGYNIGLELAVVMMLMANRRTHSST
jgi:hypothetical protein